MEICTAALAELKTIWFKTQQHELVLRCCRTKINDDSLISLDFFVEIAMVLFYQRL